MRKQLIEMLLKKMTKKPQFKEQSNTKDIELKKQSISTQYDQNLATFKSIFSLPKNADIKVREFTIRSLNRRAFIIYIGTMVDIKNIQDGIVKPLIENEQPSGQIQNIVSYPVQKTDSNIGKITESITSGVTALFVDGDHQCYLFETTQIRGRSIEKSQNEVIVKGAKEAFNEKVIDNISLIRKK